MSELIVVLAVELALLSSIGAMTLRQKRLDVLGRRKQGLVWSAGITHKLVRPWARAQAGLDSKPQDGLLWRRISTLAKLRQSTRLS
jgi:hypothetical protein